MRTHTNTHRHTVPDSHSHSTYLNFFWKNKKQILNDLLFAARNAGLIVQENIVKGGLGRWSVINTLKGLQSAYSSRGREL